MKNTISAKIKKVATTLLLSNSRESLWPRARRKNELYYVNLRRRKTVPDKPAKAEVRV